METIQKQFPLSRKLHTGSKGIVLFLEENTFEDTCASNIKSIAVPDDLKISRCLQLTVFYKVDHSECNYHVILFYSFTPKLCFTEQKVGKNIFKSNPIYITRQLSHTE